MKQHDSKRLTVRTPGKLILSGEHAVVYGNFALAMAIDRYTETTICEQANPKSILFRLPKLRYAQSHSFAALRRLKQGIQERYQHFLQGQYGIRDVLREPFELLQYAVTQLLDDHDIKLPKGLDIHTDSNIPMGCGLGSSAASVVSVMVATTYFSQPNINLESCFELAVKAENMQHGQSSGVDVHLVLHGGCIRFKKTGQKEIRPIPKQSLLLVNTGSPQSTTGECVSMAADTLQGNQALLDEFARVTDCMDTAFTDEDDHLLKEAIRDNHQLLVSIGVVPQTVQHFIQEIEQQGGAAKICGAGAVKGQSAGIILVVADHDINDCIQRYGYQSMRVQGEPKGTHVV